MIFLCISSKPFLNPNSILHLLLLLVCQFILYPFYILFCSSITIQISNQIPVISFFIILFYSFSIFITISKNVLSFCKSLFSGSFKPAEGFLIVLFYTFSIFITISQIVLSICITLFSGSFKPAEGFLIVLSYTFSNVITYTKIKLSFCKSLFSCR